MFFYTFLPKLLNMSLTASVAIVLVILLRLLLKKAPKVISYALWGVVLFRLLCPASIGSDFSFYNLFDAPTERTGPMTSVIEYVPSDIVHTEYPSVALPVPGVGDRVNEALPQGQEQLAADPLEAPIAIATCVWMAGVSIMAIYSVVSYIRLRRKLMTAVPLRENIFIADDIQSPFVMGLFRPKIYLPCSLGDKEQEYIILHEQHHIRRFDHVFKALAFLALAIHWFDPLVWVAFVLAGKDMEMSCDEAVVREMGEDVRADYSASLLALATGRRVIAGTPLAFGEGDPKGRIKNLANWWRPTFWVIVLAVIVCAVAAVCLLTNPNPSQPTLGSRILGYLGATEEEAALVAEGLITPNVSVTLDDTEITVTEMLYDDRFAYLAYEVRLPEGFPEDAQPPWLGSSFCLAPTGSDEKDTWHDFMPVSEERSGRVIRVIAQAHLGFMTAGDACDAVLFLTRPEDTVGEDYRELRWSLTGSPLAQTCEVNERVWDGGPTLTRLSVSPLSVCAMLEGAEPFDGLTVQVFFKDGTMFDATRARVTSGLDVTYLADGTPVIHGGDTGYFFGRIVDVSAIERVVAGDVEVLMG